MADKPDRMLHIIDGLMGLVEKIEDELENKVASTKKIEHACREMGTILKEARRNALERARRQTPEE